MNTYEPDVKGREQALAQSQQDLLASARHVEAASKGAANKADFFAPERGRYIKGLNSLMTGGRSAIAADPSYKFRYEQGQKALESSLAAQGLLSSGRAALELQKFGQEQASSEFQNQYQRLLELAGVGQSNPTAAANIMYQGSQAPFQASQSIAGQVFQSAQSDKDRAAKMAMLRLNHEFEIDQMRYQARLQQEEQARSQQAERGGASISGGGGESFGSTFDRYKQENREWQARNAGTPGNRGSAGPSSLSESNSSPPQRQMPTAPPSYVSGSTGTSHGATRYTPMAFAGVSAKNYASFKSQNRRHYG